MDGVNEKLDHLLPVLRKSDVRLLKAALISANFSPGSTLL